MKLLLIDASTTSLSIAVSDGEKIVRFRNALLERKMAESTTVVISQLLAKAGIPLKKIDGFAVGLGPGSFTSLRVGLSTVKALSFATGKPLVGVPSLDILAMNAPRSAGETICTLVDARRNLFYSCLYQRTDSGIKRIGDYALSPLSELLPSLAGKILFIGDGIKTGRDTIEQHAATVGPKSFAPVFAGERLWRPQAKNMLPLVLPRFQSGKTDDRNKLLPLYLYSADCQVRPATKR